MEPKIVFFGSLTIEFIMFSNGTGGSRLSQIFWEHENLSSLSIIRLIQLV